MELKLSHMRTFTKPNENMLQEHVTTIVLGDPLALRHKQGLGLSLPDTQSNRSGPYRNRGSEAVPGAFHTLSISNWNILCDFSNVVL